ncbi:aldo/keto reductase [Erwinia amylovora]|uniref:Aldo-keto reductase family 1 member C1 homolog n=3 Tax=Erwinia amylovora TaxID=552 RepID=A0A831A1V9_ERWAM|nr:aldo/keto reductase [Erwinia amylovora]CDK15446.1 Aldo-keto reductase family 1 member C1-like protein [Erwinia amylovora LA635]CDK18813.1 Aldo-keto reductase family 1 member C1-like protein [Erwinia amylovora LA636]CDK22183.1 Aldo-keto reductase family 1 member C1-like protein [Erwinia amylovora LA637]ATZ11740.1 aldo/keto reductase [Erwinia amylovora]EKV54685.1 Aldo-keto reductase family 1 member C1-like protein [Erwinia amylovora ACW56400]
MSRTVVFTDGAVLPAIGQGTWFMGEEAGQHRQEVTALQAGLDMGLTLIDTAEMYADGGAERVVGDALIGRRDSAWLVSKFYPWHAGEFDALAACERSLKRLKTDYLDLYLLHWRGNIPLEETIRAMDALQQQGKIRRWGVSNFDSDSLQELWSEKGGNTCAGNQILYHLASRGVEFDLLPACQQQGMPVMAYCPLARAGRLRGALMNHPVLQQIAQQKRISIAQLLLAWVIRNDGVIAIPKASSIAHVKDNAAALGITFNSDELALINQAFPPPTVRVPLDVV